MRIELNFELWLRQLQAFVSYGTEILFGGATEGGKSHLIRVALIVWCLAIPGLQCVLIRKKFDDILKNHVEGPTGFRALLAPLVDAKLVSITEKGIRFPRGSVIAFVHCQDERQFTSAQGVEKHVIVIDEATQITERLIRFFRTWCRMPEEMQEVIPERFKGQFPRIIYTANPIGASVGFFRRHFVFAREPFEIEEVEGFLRQYIPSRYTDNLSVDVKAHKGRLQGIGDEQLAKALDDGDWSALAGDYFKEWDEDRHVVENFKPPKHWFKYRTFDWGSAEPFAVYWWCVSDGDEFIDQAGRKRWFPEGALIAYREWFGGDPERPAEGIRLSNPQIAAGIKRRTLEPMSGITLTDRLPFNDLGMVKEGKTYVMADDFLEAGVPLTRGNLARVYGGQQVKKRLVGKELAPGIVLPMIYFVKSCKWARDHMAALGRDPLNPEAPAKDGEPTHVCDAVRYACAAKPITVKKPTGASTSSSNTMTPALARKKVQRQKRRGRNGVFD